jgi:HK97 family phage prohead protease
MPYYIAEPGTTADCSTWATVKETNGSIDVIGCHQYKQDAIDQAVAISLSEGDETLFKGDWARRNDEGEQIIISDLDDTLLHAGERMTDVYEYLESLDRPVFIVTGRPESDREATIAELEAADIDYAQLIMNPGSSAESNEYKKATAQTLLETYNIILAVENNPDARAGYAELGLEVLDPADIKPAEEEPMPEDQPEAEEPEEGRQLELNQPKGNSLSKIETRVASQAFEIREDGDGMTFTGYAAMWDSPSQPLPFTERIQRGAFKRSLQSRNDIKLLWNHDTGSILGSTRAGTLTLTEDDRGLRATAKFPNTTLGRDTAELIRTGNVDSMSFGFSVPEGGDKWSQDGSERTLVSVRIHEVSLVAFPAYTSTAGTVSVRAYQVVAERAEVDPEELATAISAMEEGKELTLDQASLIRKVVDRISPEQPKPEGDALMLALKKKKLEMLEKTNGN